MDSVYPEAVPAAKNGMSLQAERVSPRICASAALQHNGSTKYLMNTATSESIERQSVSGGNVDANRNHAIPLRILRRLEVLGLEMDHAKLKRTGLAGGDAWYAGVGGEAYGPTRFREVMQLLVDGHSPVSVLHASQEEEPEPAWRELRYAPMWLRPWPARLWTIGFWFVCAILGAILVTTLSPDAWQPWTHRVYWVGVAGAALWQWAWLRETVRVSRLWRRFRSTSPERQPGDVSPEIAAFWEEASREDSDLAPLPAADTPPPAHRSPFPILARVAGLLLVGVSFATGAWLALGSGPNPQMARSRLTELVDTARQHFAAPPQTTAASTETALPSEMEAPDDLVSTPTRAPQTETKAAAPATLPPELPQFAPALLDEP